MNEEKAALEAFEGIVRPAFDYFPVRVHRGREAEDRAESAEPPLSPTRRYLFAYYHPHGVYAFGLFSALFPGHSGWDALFSGSGEPEERRRRFVLIVGVASALLHAPLIGTLFRYVGFLPAGRETLADACQTSEHDIALIPGGIAEMTAFSGVEHEEVLFLLQRRGFIRLAIESGRDLVPVFCFGENRTFKQSTFLRLAREQISRLRLSFHLFRGRWFTLIPFKVPLNVVVGDPVQPPIPHRVGGGPAADEAVEALHREYVRAVYALFNSNKARYGYADATLRMK